MIINMKLLSKNQFTLSTKAISAGKNQEIEFGWYGDTKSYRNFKKEIENIIRRDVSATSIKEIMNDISKGNGYKVYVACYYKRANSDYWGMPMLTPIKINNILTGLLDQVLSRFGMYKQRIFDTSIDKFYGKKDEIVFFIDTYKVPEYEEKAQKIIGYNEKVDNSEILYNNESNDYQIKNLEFRNSPQDYKKASNPSNDVIEQVENIEFYKPSSQEPRVKTVSYYDINDSEKKCLYVLQFDSYKLNLEQLQTCFSKDYQLISENEYILLNNRNIAMVNNIATDLFSNYMPYKDYFESVEEVISNKDKIEDEYKIGLKRYKTTNVGYYDYPTGIGEYTVYFTDGNGNDFCKIRKYNQPVSSISTALVDKMINFEIYMSQKYPITDPNTNTEYWYTIIDSTSNEENLNNMRRLYKEGKSLVLIINYEINDKPRFTQYTKEELENESEEKKEKRRRNNLMMEKIKENKKNKDKRPKKVPVDTSKSSLEQRDETRKNRQSNKIQTRRNR